MDDITRRLKLLVCCLKKFAKECGQNAEIFKDSKDYLDASKYGMEKGIEVAYNQCAEWLEEIIDG